MISSARTDAMRRRYKLLRLRPDVLLNVLMLNATSPGDVVNKLSVENVPDGTEIVTRWYDPMRQVEVFLLHHSSWDSVPEDKDPPELKVEVIPVTVGLRHPRTVQECLQPLRTSSGIWIDEMINHKQFQGQMAQTAWDLGIGFPSAGLLRESDFPKASFKDRYVQEPIKDELAGFLEMAPLSELLEVKGEFTITVNDEVVGVVHNPILQTGMSIEDTPVDRLFDTSKEPIDPFGTDWSKPKDEESWRDKEPML